MIRRLFSGLSGRRAGSAWGAGSTSVDGRGASLHPRTPGRVHLGCGEVYLRGYLNVDYPPEHGTAGGRSRPDLEADIRTLRCASAALTEIRLHHVFEHFERAEALALLVRWHDWLVPGGELRIETPDFEACVEGFAGRTVEQQFVILRHLFGSQEAPWARHLDGWSERRFREVLGRLGYEVVEATKGASDGLGLLLNVTVRARKADGAPWRNERVAEARRLLALSMNGPAAVEQELLARWSADLDAALALDSRA